MTREQIVQFIENIIKDIMGGNDFRNILNPAGLEKAFDTDPGIKGISEDDLKKSKAACEELGHMFWKDEKSASNYDLLIEILHNADLCDCDINLLADIMVQGICNKNPGFIKKAADDSPVVQPEVSELLPDDLVYEGSIDDPKDDTVEAESGDPSSLIKVSAHQIYKYLDQHIFSQKEAKKAASMLLWEHVRRIKSNMVFMGPTASGKTEIFRQLKKLYPDIYIVDASSITQDGWKGNFKLADIFKNIGSVKCAERSIIAMDEADKYFEPQTASGGENVSYNKQSELLKVIEGEKLHIGEWVIDTSKISWVFLGSFESMIEGKKHVPNDVGFGGSVEKNQISYMDKFTAEDLVKYAGVRNEIAGRIGRIVQLKPMDEDSLYQILNNPDMSPINEISMQFGKKLEFSDSMKHQIAKEAADSHLGVRYMKTRIKTLLETRIFEDEEKDCYQIS